MPPAMTRPTPSPPSPLTQDSQSFHLAGSTTPTSVSPLCPSPLKDESHSQSLSPGHLSPGYVGVPKRQGIQSRDRAALSHIQSSVSSPKLHVLPQRTPVDGHSGSPKEPFGPRETRHDPEPASSPSHLQSRSHTMTVIWKDAPTGQESECMVVSQSSALALGPHSISSTIPHSRGASSSAPRSGTMISPEACAELLQSRQGGIMLLDVRPYSHFSNAHVKESLNLCVPTTLLKRRSFGTQKLEATFTDEAEKGLFAGWKQCSYIIVYDATTANMKDAAPLLNVLNKFTAEGWTGEGLIVRGGFNAFADTFPDLIRLKPFQVPASDQPSGLPSVAPVVGGCTLPESSTTAVPFFGNIRQNTDLLGGVGQMTPKLPVLLTESRRQQLLPDWLRVASDPADRGLRVSQRFLDLEKNELERMQEALSYDKTVESIAFGRSKRFRIAGIEKGSKNRYNDIYPFEHSRVRLQAVPTGGCDYVNASHMKVERSDKSYIATQAPVPDTFNDFWRVVWEQDVKVLVSLTAEVERGQVKCHPFWEPGEYGALRVNNIAETHIPLATEQRNPETESIDDPRIIVRHLSLSHSAFPFQPLREITQLQYPYWPDFGTTAQPSHLVELIEQCDQAIRASDAGAQGVKPPMLVHCSAGCGRTGAFCTVDSVLDILKRRDPSRPDEQDLIAQTVGDFRMQRPSMVQNLSQFVLCYESVLEWVTSQMETAAE